MKILITYLTFGENIFAGIERSLHSLSLGLIAIGNEVFIYTSRFSNISNTSKINIIFSNFLKSNFNDDAGHIDCSIESNYSEFHDQIRNELREIINEYKPDYILAVDHLWGILPFIDIFNDFECKSGIIFHMYYNSRYIDLALTKPFDHIFSVSNYLTKKLKSISSEFDHRNIDIMLLPNSVVTSDFNMNIPKKEKALLFCNSRLCLEKGIDILLEAFTKVVKAMPDAHLVFCGGSFHFGSNTHTIELINKTILNNKLQDKISVIPLLSWASIPEWVCGSDCVILPTKEETFGIAALEAMAAGTPLIATSVGNIPDLVGEAGILIEEGNAHELVIAILNVIANKNDLKDLIDRGKTKAEQYDYIKVARDFISIIQEC